MAKKKFYAVRVGRVSGIYQTWEQAKEQIDGFSGAEYKSFLTEDEARNYILGNESQESVTLSS